MEAAKTAAEAAMDGAGDRVTSIRPVQTKFIPNNLTKGLAGLSVAMGAIMYASVKLNQANRDAVQEAFKRALESQRNS